MDRKQIREDEYYRDCTLCPRNCHISRLDGKVGYCRAGAEITAARAALHHWEEPCISGRKGSGTVFFSGCSLGCVYCQNYDISRNLAGKIITTDRLAEIFLELQEQKAHNINLVTPGHYVPSIIKAIGRAKEGGLHIPVVYNSSGYESVETVKMLEGVVDIYLPDFKYYGQEMAYRYSGCRDYFEAASQALEEMVRQTGEAVFEEEIMRKGVIVRHLLLPGGLADSKKIIKYLYETYKDTIYISIMNQYTPLEQVKEYPEINRKVTEKEYEALVDYALELGVENGFIQEGETASESFIPAFDYRGI
ncbi:4Fe-4S cluster-binding domain-containing protein [Anaerocolumna xylanovorans]|uniref:Putative pyruvate formate lyase activating enzyme n=1 Tax=Anaerocolumna xylanovorans DSM 12503 TaxID=1121345 RepID=A0A1M7YIU5_9FIRM|nr:4Fe-4S cluster-binding domain-containing protein [Anaerocolumna xylanovorans]SHO52519.1 putative pyruvate formate lyase activating enzyme [Anaerocolumna xylanovorans DSM 12503]